MVYKHKMANRYFMPSLSTEVKTFKIEGNRVYSHPLKAHPAGVGDHPQARAYAVAGLMSWETDVGV